MRWRVLTVVAAAGLVVLLASGPALAKGADQATISGPDLAQPIVLSGNGEPGSGERLGELGDGSGLFLAMFGGSGGQELTGAAPAGPLGPKYQLAYRVPGGAPTPDVVRQDLYPMAAGGPVTYTAAGQPAFGGTTRGGWYRAPDGFARLLATLGLPVAPGGRPSASPTGARQVAATDAGSGGGVPWAVWAAVWAAAAALVAGAAGTVLWRVRHRP